MKIVDRDVTKDEREYIYNDFAKIEIGMGIPQVERKRFSYIAEKNGELVGFVSGLGAHKWLTMTDMWVKAEHRRKDIGARLLQMFEEKIKALGIEHIHTWIMNMLPGNEYDYVWTIGCGNEHFYEKMGYSIYTIIENFFDIDGIHHIGYKKDFLPKSESVPLDYKDEHICFVDREIMQNELELVYKLMKQERQNIFPQRSQIKYSRVIEDSGEVIGYVAGYTNHKWFMLTDMWTKPGYRRQGLGSKLLLLLEEHVRNIGMKHVYTWTTGGNNARYYESLGYKCFAVFENSFGVEGIHHIGYRKDFYC